jgi:hypothetical protein
LFSLFCVLFSAWNLSIKLAIDAKSLVTLLNTHLEERNAVLDPASNNIGPFHAAVRTEPDPDPPVDVRLDLERQNSVFPADVPEEVDQGPSVSVEDNVAFPVVFIFMGTMGCDLRDVGVYFSGVDGSTQARDQQSKNKDHIPRFCEHTAVKKNFGEEKH